MWKISFPSLSLSLPFMDEINILDKCRERGVQCGSLAIETTACHIKSQLLCFQQLPANTPEKTVENGLSAWAPVTDTRGLDAVPGS